MADVTDTAGTVPEAIPASPAPSGTAATTQPATTERTTTTQAAAAPTQEEDPEKARLARELSDVRREAAAARVKLKEFETAQLTAEQQRDARLAELETETAQLRETAKRRTIEAAITAAATQKGVKPGLAVKLVDLSKIAFDEDGNVTNADDLVTLLAQENPELINPGGIGLGNPGRGGGAIDAATHEAQLRQILGGGHSSPFSVEVARRNPVIIPK